MELIRLTNPDDPHLAAAMALYAESFPLHEQRLPQSQRRILAHPQYHFDLIWHQAAFAGLMLYWEREDFLYVEHFCTLPQLRGQGLGACALELLAKRRKPLILEIDPPVDEVSRRRRGFYLRSGFCENAFAHVHPAYRSEFSGHNLTVLSHPRPLAEREYAAFAEYLSTVVMAV